MLPVSAEPGIVHPMLHSVQHVDHEAGLRDWLAVELRRIDAGCRSGWTDERDPYPGLRPFDADLHQVFFGRDDDIKALANVLRSPAERPGGVVLVVGPSGCGKSSLVGRAPRGAEVRMEVRDVHLLAVVAAG